MSVLKLDLFEAPLEIGDLMPVFLFEFLSDLLLVDHDLVGSLFVAFVALLCLQEIVLQMGHLHIGFIIDFIDPAVEHYLQSVDLRYG